MTLGLTDGTETQGLFTGGLASGIAYNVLVGAAPNLYGANIGTPLQGENTKKDVGAGLTSDKTKSGVIADLTDNAITAIIKY